MSAGVLCGTDAWIDNNVLNIHTSWIILYLR